MSIKSKVGWGVLIVFIVYLIAIGVHDGFREANRQFFLDIAGPTISNSANGLWIVISTNPIYQQYHPLLWVGGTLLLAFGIHQLKNADKIPLLHKAKPIISPNVQTSPPSQPVPIRSEQAPTVVSSPEPEKEATT